MKVVKVDIGDVVRLRKKHPCGGDQWQVVSLGVDVRIKCLTCQRQVLLERGVFDRRVRSVVSQNNSRQTA